MSKQLNRKPLKINNRTSVKQEFGFNPVLGYKSDAQPSVVTWRSPGKGVEGESYNSQNTADKFIINKRRKPL
jgi:hypothetical protein